MPDERTGQPARRRGDRGCLVGRTDDAMGATCPTGPTLYGLGQPIAGRVVVSRWLSKLNCSILLMS